MDDGKCSLTKAYLLFPGPMGAPPSRNVPPPTRSAERKGQTNSGSVLFPFLKKYGGISSPHSPHTGMGTDWRDNDPSVDTIVEIWEGSRTSA